MPNKRQCPKAILDVKDVALEWDADPDQRARMRDEKSVLKPGPACQDISTCIQHRGLLIPLLERMAKHDHRPVPQIDALKEEVLSLLKIHKLGVDSEVSSDSNIAKAAWAIRKFCGFVKGKVRRSEVSTVPRMQFVYRLLPLEVIVASIFNKFVRVSCWDLQDHSLDSLALSTRQVKYFQDLCLILDPMLQAVMLQIASADLCNLHVGV